MHRASNEEGSAVALEHAPRRSSPVDPDDRGDLSCWFDDLRGAIGEHVSEFVRAQCETLVRGMPGAEFMGELVEEFVAGGKYLRSTFLHLGWLSGAERSESALRAAGSAELLHAFALVQDDVMDGSALRRGAPTAHVRFAEWHRRHGLSGSPERFGESAAVLVGDLSLVWAEQMLRSSGLSSAALDRAWPCYDTMRSELAVGQLADLINDDRAVAGFDDVLAVARRKSGNYTVRRPLEIGALLANSERRVLELFSAYGALVGEAFQLRDDLLGVFGSASTTGKPCGEDLRDRKATSVVVLARELASPGARSRMDELVTASDLTDSDIARWAELIADTSAPERIEELISDRVAEALRLVSAAPIDDFLARALSGMATRCTSRQR